ncbi:MAG: transaldolase family protein [Desulfocapsaceae bacterium]
MNPSVLEKLWSVEKEAEIWWDSSPLVFETWKKSMIDQAENKEEMTAWIDRMFHPDNAPEDNLFRGVTTNPPLSYAAVQDNPEYWQKWIADYAAEHGSQETEVMFWQVYKEIVKRGAETYLPMFEKTGGKFGYISGQADPRSKFDTEAMVNQGVELAAIAPNVMIKIPGTAEGYETIRILSSKGISTNNTLSMINPQFKACMDAVAAGVKEAKENGVDLSTFRSVITAMSARYGSLGDLAKEAEELGIELSETDTRWAEIAVFKKACRMVDKHPDYEGKMLLCSMRLSPVIDGKVHSWHIEKSAGENIVYTCPPPYIGDLLTKTPYLEFSDSREEQVPRDVLDKLLRIPYFAKAYAEDGYTAAEFNTHPAILETARQFAGVTEKMVNFVSEALVSCESLKK